MDILQAISTVGFPIVMCLILVFRLEKTINKNTSAIDGLALAISTKKL